MILIDSIILYLSIVANTYA